MVAKRTYYDDQQVKETNKTFAQTLVHKYKMHCKREGEVFTTSGFVMYLLTKTVIKQRTASKYMVLELYPKALYEEENKTRAVLRLEEETGLSDRTIWTMLKDQKRL